MTILEVEAILCFAFPDRIQETQHAAEILAVPLSVPQGPLLGWMCLTEAP